MHISTYVCVYIYIQMYVCMYVCMYVRMYVCVYVSRLLQVSTELICTYTVHRCAASHVHVDAHRHDVCICTYPCMRDVSMARHDVP